MHPRFSPPTKPFLLSHHDHPFSDQISNCENEGNENKTRETENSKINLGWKGEGNREKGSTLAQNFRSVHVQGTSVRRRCGKSDRLQHPSHREQKHNIRNKKSALSGWADPIFMCSLPSLFSVFMQDYIHSFANHSSQVTTKCKTNSRLHEQRKKRMETKGHRRQSPEVDKAERPTTISIVHLVRTRAKTQLRLGCFLCAHAEWGNDGRWEMVQGVEMEIDESMDGRVDKPTNGPWRVLLNTGSKTLTTHI